MLSLHSMIFQHNYILMENQQCIQEQSIKQKNPQIPKRHLRIYPYDYNMLIISSKQQYFLSM